MGAAIHTPSDQTTPDKTNVDILTVTPGKVSTSALRLSLERDCARIQALPSAEVQKAIKRYPNAQGRQKAAALVSILDAAPPVLFDTLDKRESLNRLRNCGRDGRYRDVKGTWNSYPVRCKHAMRPRCDIYTRDGEAKARAAAVKECFPNGMVNRDEVSWLTINIGRQGLDTEFTALRDRFKKTLTSLFRNRLSGCAVLGSFHIAIQDGISVCYGMLHLHAVLIHIGRSRGSVDAALRDKFQINGPSDVHIVPLFPDKEIDQSLEDTIMYALDVTPSGGGQLKPKRLRDLYGITTPTIIGMYHSAVCSIQSRGREGLTCNIGFYRLLNLSRAIPM